MNKIHLFSSAPRKWLRSSDEITSQIAEDLANLRRCSTVHPIMGM